MIPPATQHKLPTPLGIITLVNVSHGYYSHSYAAMQSSSRFCRKNGVCGISTNSLRTTKPSQQTNKKNQTQLICSWDGKQMGKILWHTQQNWPLCCTTGDRGKIQWNEGQPPAGSLPAPSKCGSLLIFTDNRCPSCNSQETKCAHYYLTLHHYMKSQ